MVQKYLGMQVLLWNYPGQAFTEWRPEQLINNEYIANCLNEVLGQVGEKGTKALQDATLVTRHQRSVRSARRASLALISWQPRSRLAAPAAV